MSYKFPSTPSKRAYIEEIADYWEMLALKHENRPISKVEVIKSLNISSDEINIEGISSEEDDLDIELDSVFVEFNYRVKSCGKGKYPFVIGGNSIEIKDEVGFEKDIYDFLLLTTRINMKTNRVFNDIDGTLVFEELCAKIGIKIFGEGTDGIVFGTGAEGGFQDKVENLIDLLNEGGAFLNRNNNTPTAKDDSVDVVFWKDFEDKEHGKLIGFGQCKTGTNWRNEISKLNPRRFVGSWFRDTPILNPIPIIFLSDTLNKEKNNYSEQVDKLFLNRFRIISYLENEVDEEILKKIKAWNSGAIGFIKSN